MYYMFYSSRVTIYTVFLSFFFQFFFLSALQSDNKFYNIGSRAGQSNSVYVSVLKIPIVHADGMGQSLRQIFFSRERPLLAGGKYYILRQ